MSLPNILNWRMDEKIPMDLSSENIGCRLLKYIILLEGDDSKIKPIARPEDVNGNINPTFDITSEQKALTDIEHKGTTNFESLSVGNLSHRSAILNNIANDLKSVRNNEPHTNKADTTLQTVRYNSDTLQAIGNEKKVHNDNVPENKSDINSRKTSETFETEMSISTVSSEGSSRLKRSFSFGDKPINKKENNSTVPDVNQTHIDEQPCNEVGNHLIWTTDSSSTELDGTEDSWRFSLEEFTSKRQGTVRRKSKSTPKGLRSFYKVQDELIDDYVEIRKNKQEDTIPYYKSQDDLINQYEEIRLELDDAMENAETMKKLQSKANLYAKITFLTNLVLLAIKIIAVVLSGSISLISSLVDSSVDLVSGVVIWVTTRAVRKTDRYVYPQGRTKLEPMAIVILSVIMAVASLQIIKESFTKIVGLSDGSDLPPIMDWVTISIASATVVIKLVLYVLCRRIPYPTVQVLAQDHRNDVLMNTFAIVFGYIGSKQMLAKTGEDGLVFLDPIGAVIISLYIIGNWCVTGWDQIKLLIGHTATPEFLSKITWICMDHHKKIQAVDTVRAFHFGNHFLVEADIVLPPDMTLREAHDIGQPLQQKIERLPNVERAFVHIDYEALHDPKTEHKVV